MKGVHMLAMGEKGAGYGFLYNAFAAANANFAPTDWKVPTEAEIETLIDYVGDSTNAGGYLKEAGTTHWNSPNTGADNSSGFTALGSGFRLEDGDFFNSIKNNFGIHSSDGIYFTILYNSASINNSGPVLDNYGFSIRLLYTGAGTPTTVTDYDGNVYDVVQIGTQYWTKQNWKCTRLNNGTSIPLVTDNTTWAGLTTLARCAYSNDMSYV